MATDTKIILKRSDITTATPNLDYVQFGEFAFNYRDEKLYYRSYDIDGTTEIVKNYEFQRVVPVAKGGTGATTDAQARLNLGAAPLDSPSFTGIASLADSATPPTTALTTGAADGRRLATVAYVRAEIADDAPTKTGGGASGTSWAIGITGNAATATKLATARTISQGTTSDINFSYTFDGNANITPNLTINSSRASAIQTALSLVPGTNIQRFDADLSAIAALTGTSGLLRKTATDIWSLDTETYTPTSRTVTVYTGNGIEGGSTTAQDLNASRSWTLGLTDTGVLASGTTATYNDNSKAITPFTVDAKGRITAAGQPVTIAPLFASIDQKPTTLGGYGITDALNTSSTAQVKAGNLTAANFIKSGGTSSQFLKADGSSDGTPYTPTSTTLTISTDNGITGGTVAQTLASNRSWTFGLTGQASQLHNLVTDGFFVRSTVLGASSMVARSIAVGSGLSITNADGVSGNPTITLTMSNLTSLRDLSTTGFLTRTGPNTLSAKSIAVSGVGLSITNADGVAPGNPTISSNATSANTASAIVARDASGNFRAGAITGTSFIVSNTTNAHTITLSGTPTANRTLTLPDKADPQTIATLTDIPDHSDGANTTIAAAPLRVLSAITVNSFGHTTSVSSKDLAATDIPSLDATKITTGTFDTARITDETVTGKLLTGLGAPVLGQIHQTDSILYAFRKLQGNLTIKADTASPTFTGSVTLPTGSATAAPLRFVSGTNLLTTPVSGAVEFNGTNLFITNSVSRKTIAYTDSNITGNASTSTTATRLATAQTISQGAASDINFSYSFDGSANITPNLTINSSRASAIRDSLGLTIGPGGIQAYDADLAAIAALADGPDDDTAIDTGFLRKTGENTWAIDPNIAPIPGTEVTTITGDVVGSSGIGDRNIVATLATVPTVTAGTYNNSATAITPFTVDAKGRVTATGSAVTITPHFDSITDTPITLAGYGISDAQALNANLTSISALGTAGSNGLLRRNAGNTWSFDTTSYTPTARTLTFTTGNGISGGAIPRDLAENRGWTFGLTGQAKQLHELQTDGFFVRSTTDGNSSMVARSIAVGSGLDISNADGVSGNPTISLTTSNLTSLRALATNGFLAHTGTNTITPRSIVIASGSTGLSITYGDGVLGNPTLTLSSTSANVNNSLVVRDASGNFAANTITANTFNGGATLTGTPTAPTAAVSTNSTQIATTAFVLGQAADAAPPMNGIASAGSVPRFARADHVHATDTTRAPLASPTFTGTATAPTVSAGNYLVTGNSTTASGVAVQRVLSKTIPTGHIARLAEFTAAEGNVAIEIQVSSNTNSNSGTSTYIFQGGYLSLQATNPATNSADFYRLYPFSDGRGHGEGTDTGLATTPWMIMIYQVQHSGSTGGYGVAIVNSSATVARSVTVTITELRRGMSFTDRSADSTVSFGTSAGNLYSHTNLLVGNRIGVGKVPTTALDVNGTIAATNLTLSGNLTVNGTATILNSNDLTIDDKNITLGSVAAITGVSGNIIGTTTTTTITGLSSTTGMIPGQTLTKTSGTGAFGGTTTITNIISATVISITSTTANTAGAIVFDIGGATDVTASGGGITLKGTTDKTFNWVSSTGAWTSSEDLNLASGKVYEINGTSVLSATGLGSSVTSSSLTSVGTITSGTWSGSFGAVSGANLTSLTAGNLSGTIPSAVLANSSVNIGTTSVALNRASANLALTGISSVTLPGSTSGSVQIIPVAAAGTTVLTLPATTGTVVTTGDTGTVSSAMIVNGTIVDGDISTSAAIAGTKISPNFGSQTIQTTGTASFGRTKFNRQDTATEGGEIVLGRAHNNDDAWIIDAANDLYAPDLRFYDVYSGLTRLLIKSTNGNVGIGKTNPSTALDVNGTVTATTFVGNLIGTASAIADGAVTQASTSNMLVPAGAVMAFAMNSAPTGWLVCDGRAVDRSGPSGYPTLFAAIGTTYGVGNNSTTFNLPNLQGIFVRGSGSQTVNGVSYSRTHATTQNDALQNISGTVGQFDAAFAPTVATGAFTTTQVTRTTGGGGSGKYLTADFDASRVARADVETRPVNIAMLYCIKI